MHNTPLEPAQNRAQRRRGPAKALPFDPKSLFVGRPHNSVGKRVASAEPSAREWFAHLRPVLLASRPVLEPAREVRYPKTVRISRVDKKTGEKKWRTVQREQVVTRPARLGKPAFQNRIDDNGEHV
jgi:hypothetical protein